VTLNSTLRTLFVFLAGGLIGSAATLVLTKPKPVIQVLSPPPAVPQIRYEPRTFADLPGWKDDRYNDVLPALAKTCARINDDDAPQRLGELTITSADRKAACAAVLAAGLAKAELRAAIEAAFQPVAVIANGQNQGTFTGYYEAALNGSLRREGPYQYPLYGVPKNLINVALNDFISPAALEGSDIPRTVVGRLMGQQLKPFYTREEIDLSNAVAEDSAVVAWIDDPVDVHVLHIQGSGQVTLPDGAMMRVGSGASSSMRVFYRKAQRR
jgi:membrane-bound lytic murein transglycosylase A